MGRAVRTGQSSRPNYIGRFNDEKDTREPVQGQDAEWAALPAPRTVVWVVQQTLEDVLRSRLPEEAMSAEPNPKYGHPDSAEEKEKRAAAERHMAAVERNEWLQLWRIYERCVDIAHKVWDAKLDAASAQQQTLAEQMRDRAVMRIADGPADDATLTEEERAIAVPLFTPRDRLQFIKEVAVNLTISAGQRGLSIRFPKEWTPKDAETKHEAGNGAEAASGTSEEALDTEASQVAAAGTAP